MGYLVYWQGGPSEGMHLAADSFEERGRWVFFTYRDAIVAAIGCDALIAMFPTYDGARVDGEEARSIADRLAAEAA
jgi:hypothetical protein